MQVHDELFDRGIEDFMKTLDAIAGIVKPYRGEGLVDAVRRAASHNRLVIGRAEGRYYNITRGALVTGRRHGFGWCTPSGLPYGVVAKVWRRRDGETWLAIEMFPKRSGR